MHMLRDSLYLEFVSIVLAEGVDKKSLGSHVHCEVSGYFPVDGWGGECNTRYISKRFSQHRLSLPTPDGWRLTRVSPTCCHR